LLLPEDHFLRRLAGVSTDVRLEVISGSGSLKKKLDGSLLCTHFGISGPVVLDISRHYLNSHFDDPATKLSVNWLPSKNEQIETELLQLNRSTIGSWLRKQLPERLARALCDHAGMDENIPGHQLTREQRQKMRNTLAKMELPITGDRGFRYAEVTAGGVPLNEVNLNTMESRKTPGLFLCGEICDVDGRIGGFNFQWAWSSGYVAGVSAAKL
jgi:predicted Rossmann fold flavoprotein